MATKQYKVKNSNLLHNGFVVKIGDTIALDDKEAEKLQDVLTPIAEPKISNKPKNKTQSKTPVTVTKTKEPDTNKSEDENNGK